MSIYQRLKFYLIGVSLGSVFVFLIFQQKGFNFAYFPNARLLDEVHNKPKVYSSKFISQLEILKLDTIFIQNQIFTSSKVDFEKSQPRAKPCGKYICYYPKQNPIYEVKFEKCYKQVIPISIKKI